MTFGEKLKITREKCNLSQRQVGERLGVTQQTIAQYEKTIDQPKMSTVRKLADALGVSISELVIDWELFSPSEVWDDMNDRESDYDNINPRQIIYDNRIINNFHTLNEIGQGKAIEQVELLTKIPEYQKKDK